jgi:hypothetical protein
MKYLLWQLEDLSNISCIYREQLVILRIIPQNPNCFDQCKLKNLITLLLEISEDILITQHR